MSQCQAEHDSADGTIWYCMYDRDVTHLLHVDDEGYRWQLMVDHRYHLAAS